MGIGVIDINPSSAVSAAQGFVNTVRSSIFSIMDAVEVGRFDKSFTQSGFQFGLGASVTAGASVSSAPTATNPYPEIFPRNYNIGTMTLTANVIIKKRMFTTLQYDNDPRFMDTRERAFMRTSKALFQMKAFQIATYEALTKFEQVLQQDHTIYVPAVLAAVQNAAAFGALTDDESSGMEAVLLQIAKRDLAGVDTNFTTWFINQFDADLANIGTGVGTIELTNFTKLNAGNRLDGEGSAEVEFEDPYHVMLISNDDIETAIANALYNSTLSTLLPSLNIGGLQSLSGNLQDQQNSGNPIIAAQATAAINTIQQTSNNVVAAQAPSPEIITFVRKKMRRFYLGKGVIQPSDGIHIFLKSDSVFENDEDPVGLPLGLDRFGVDDEILKQEMYAVTKDRDFDFNLYKILRDKNAFSGASVFAGVVDKATDNLNEGFYTFNIMAQNNFWYLKQSFINTQPALDQKQGYLYDPLTAYDTQYDSAGNIKTSNASGQVGSALLQDNLDRLNQIKVTYESGTQRGTAVSSSNVINGVVPGTTVQQIEHFPGMAYKWKEGVAAFPIITTTSDNTGLNFAQSPEAMSNSVGLPPTSTLFDNMDAANVVSILVTGKPYNISTFINDSSKVSTLTAFFNSSSSNSTSYFGNSFFDIISRQNKVLGNFQPLLNGESVSIDNLKKLAYKQTSFAQINVRVGQLEDQILTAQNKLNNLSTNANAADSALIATTKQGLQAEINQLTQEENLLIQQYAQTSQDLQSISNNQDALNLSSDPDERQLQIEDLQYKQIFMAQRRIEDVRYNRDVNYFIVGTEYDTDLDIQAFVANMRSGFKYYDNTYDPVFNKAQEAAHNIEFEFFVNESGNIVFRPPQYNKLPLSVYAALFAKQGQQGVTILPEFVQNLFSDNITSNHENIVRQNWQMLLALGKSGDDATINALNAYVPNQTRGIVEFLGYDGSSTVVNDGNLTSALIEFNAVNQAQIDQAIPPSTKPTNNILTVDILNSVATQYEKRFGGTRITITQDDIVSSSSSGALTQRRSLFQQLQNLSSVRNSAVKSYLSQLSNLGIDASSINGQSQQATQAAVQQAVMAQQNQLAQEVLQIASMGSVGGLSKPSISPEFANLVQDDTRNLVGRGSGRRFIIRDDSIVSFRIEEAQPDFCNVTVSGAANFGPGLTSPSFVDGKLITASATDFDLWRQYGFKKRDSIQAPFLHDAATGCQPYAVFQLLRQHSKVMKGTVTVIGNEYYQLGDVVYLNDRDMVFYVTGVQHSFTNGSDFTTSLTLEYGRAPGEYVPTPLDVIGKTILKQHTSSVGVTRRQVNPDTFYFPLRPTPVLYLATIKTGDTDAQEKLLRTDSNQGRLINLLTNANAELQKPNAVLVITGFTTGSDNDADVPARIDAVKQWFMAPKLMSSGINGQTLSSFGSLNAMPATSISTKTLDLTIQDNGAVTNTTEATNPDNTIVASSDQTVIVPIGDENLELGILNACQEAFTLIGDFTETPDTLPYIIEVGIYYKSGS